MVQPIDTLKNWFRTGLKPTEQQFHDLIDSLFHKSEAIPQASIAGLATTLSTLATVASVDEFRAQSLTVASATTSVTLPAGTILTKIRIKSTSAITSLNIGTGPGGNDIFGGESLAANAAGIYTIDMDIESVTTIHFSGLSGSTNIKVYLLR